MPCKSCKPSNIFKQRHLMTNRQKSSKNVKHPVTNGRQRSSPVVTPSTAHRRSRSTHHLPARSSLRSEAAPRRLRLDASLGYPWLLTLASCFLPWRICNWSAIDLRFLCDLSAIYLWFEILWGCDSIWINSNDINILLHLFHEPSSPSCGAVPWVLHAVDASASGRNHSWSFQFTTKGAPVQSTGSTHLVLSCPCLVHVFIRFIPHLPFSCHWMPVARCG